MQLASGGKLSMLVSVFTPPDIMRPVKIKINEIQITIVIEHRRTVLELKVIVLLIKLQIKITSGAIVSLAGGGLAEVEECQGEKENNRLTSHNLETSLG